ncbi:9574_t:CDS:2, partial [Gigaspora margarita]
MPRIFVEKRSRIHALVQEGFPSRYVANKENVSQSLAVRINQKAKKTGSVKDLLKERCPRLLTEGDERTAIRLLTSDECSCTCIRRNGLSARVKRKKPLLTKKSRRERYNFAKKKYLNWSVDWRRVIWSDESKFKIYGSDGHQYCWKRKNEPFNERNIIPTKKYGGGSVMDLSGGTESENKILFFNRKKDTAEWFYHNGTE